MAGLLDKLKREIIIHIMSKNKELTSEQLAVLNDAYPVSDEQARQSYPRFGMISKDITEVTGTGKTKKIKVIQPAGTFFTEKDEGEVDEETGKKIWTRKYIEDEKVKVIIAFHRRQLRMFDASLEKFYSTPIFDNASQSVPLYLDKQVVKRGTQAELQAMWPSLTQKGKPSSKLKEETILYVLYEGELYQCNLSQSSKWEFKSYARGLNPSTVITEIGSKEETFGENTYRKMVFKNKRMIDVEEFESVNESQSKLKESVISDEKYFLSEAKSTSKADDDFNALPGGKE